MNVYAGDDVIYTPRKGEPMLARVHRLTTKRAWIVVAHDTLSGASYSVRCVSLKRLERRGGGLLDGIDR